MIKIIIGRDQNSDKLRLIVGGKAIATADNGVVPKSVGREHVCLTVDDDGSIVLRNLDINNDTYVNSIGVEVKMINQGDRIELGKDHFRLNWSLLEPFMPKFADIRPLKEVWDDYNKQMKKLKVRQKNNGLLASVPMAFTMVGGFVSSVAPPEVRPYTLILTGIAIVILFFGLYKRFTDDTIEETEKLNEKLQLNYVCPCCGRFLGNQPYSLISKAKNCSNPSCKAIYQK